MITSSICGVICIGTIVRGFVRQSKTIKRLQQSNIFSMNASTEDQFAHIKITHMYTKIDAPVYVGAGSGIGGAVPIGGGSHNVEKTLYEFYHFPKNQFNAETRVSVSYKYAYHRKLLTISECDRLLRETYNQQLPLSVASHVTVWTGATVNGYKFGDPAGIFVSDTREQLYYSILSHYLWLDLFPHLIVGFLCSCGALYFYMKEMNKRERRK